MRGKDTQTVEQARRVGITPAYAGKSDFVLLSGCSSWDHPRVCGEKYGQQSESQSQGGSPPRMRGKVDDIETGDLIHGITPAYAGKRITMLSGMLTHLGSPPRMRGKGKSRNTSNSSTRITPAYAGKRLKKSHSTVSPVAIVPLFPSVCNRPVVSNGNPAERDAPLFLPAENTVPASPAYNLRSS